MTTFELVETAEAASVDTSKHVNYKLGMIWGVDEGRQEFGFLSGRDQWMTRDFVGYGTVDGLAVSTDLSGGEPRIVVSAGTAVNPQGQLIRVPCAQCAFLNKWLADAANQDIIDSQLHS